jgi:hypothetical protein
MSNITFNPLCVIYKGGKGISISLLEVNNDSWTFPSALFHVEYRWDKKKFYWEFCFSNRWDKK